MVTNLYNKFPLCKCGCGENVTNINNSYIHGHNTRNKKLSIAHKKKLSKNKKDKTWEEIYGKKYADKFKKKQSYRYKDKSYEDLYGIEKSNNIKKKISISNTGKRISDLHKEIISMAQKGKVVSESQKEKQRIAMTGKKDSKNTKELKSKRNTERYKNKLERIKHRLNISKIKKKYLTFYKEEELRYNPDKPGEKEIQVHCKNHNCPNSKEKGGWFTPIYSQLYERIRQLENDYGNGGCYLYCSDECKAECILYNMHNDPTSIKYASREVQPELRQMRLEIDNYTCQKCGKHQDKLDSGLHCHHIEGIRWEPLESADLDKVITLCKDCHKEVHKIEGCGYHDMKCQIKFKE